MMMMPLVDNLHNYQTSITPIKSITPTQSAKQYTYYAEDCQKINSVITTRSSTPESRYHEKFFHDINDDKQYRNECNSDTSTQSSYGQNIMADKSFESNDINGPNFEIDVCPKKKKFTTPEERKLFIEDYRRKYKTELCKNWELRGTCKFGDKCSFAHGRHELQSKIALHTKYKTKPCKQYHQIGYCPYGQRCQYLHKEALKPNILFVPNEEALTSDYKCYTYETMQEINKMCNSNEDIYKILDKLPKRSRLTVFKQITNDDEDEHDHDNTFGNYDDE